VEKPEEKRVIVRLPVDLAEKLERRAKSNNRSVAGELRAILKELLEPSQTPAG
jgi:plasmid stability protein